MSTKIAPSQLFAVIQQLCRSSEPSSNPGSGPTVVALYHPFFCELLFFFLIDSFVSEANNGQLSRQCDIEMGMQVPRSNSDMGMEAFNKQTHEADKQIEKLSGLLQKLKVYLPFHLITFDD